MRKDVETDLVAPMIGSPTSIAYLFLGSLSLVVGGALEISTHEARPSHPHTTFTEESRSYLFVRLFDNKDVA